MFYKRSLIICGVFRIAHQRTKELLTERREDVEKVAKLLLEKEVITRYVFISPYTALPN